MPVFRYKAIQLDGAMAEGSLEAGGRQEAYRILDQKGLNPVSLDETQPQKSGGLNLADYLPKSSKVSFNAVENFTRQLSNLLSAGVPMSKALRLLSREASAPAAKAQWQAIHDHVIDGTSLADAMRAFPRTFSKIYVAMVHAGETGGFLDVVLNEIAEFQGRDKELRGKVMSALIYPILLAILALAAVIYLIIFFIPRLESLFDSFGGALPQLTVIVIALSDWFRQYGVYLAIVLFLAGIGIHSYFKTESGRRLWDRMVLGLPVIGPLAARFAMARFCRMLGTLIGAGVPLVTALRVALDSIGNQTLMDTVANTIDRIKKGDRLASSLADCKALFPSSVIEMIAVAEETGRLDKELIRLGEMTEKDLDRQLKMAVSLAEPLMLMLMASIIGTIIVSMILPIFSLQDSIG